eukprot:Amastigsp_a524200_4.p2 type:complete len:109 gc:universal Amastigsp_a524200_4:2-328(+)
METQGDCHKCMGPRPARLGSIIAAQAGARLQTPARSRPLRRHQRGGACAARRWPASARSAAAQTSRAPAALPRARAAAPRAVLRSWSRACIAAHRRPPCARQAPCTMR